MRTEVLILTVIILLPMIQAAASTIIKPYWSIPAIQEAIRAVAWSPDGEKLAIATSTRLYLLDYRMALLWSTTLQGEIESVKWSPASDRLAVMIIRSTGNYSVEASILIMSTDGTQFSMLPARISRTDYDWDRLELTYAWSPDGEKLAVSQGLGVAVYWANGTVAWDNTVNREPSTRYISLVSWSPTGDTVLHATYQAVRILDSRTGETVAQIAMGLIYYAAYTPRRDQIMLYTNRQHLIIYNTTTHQTVQDHKIPALLAPAQVWWIDNNTMITLNTRSEAYILGIGGPEVERIPGHIDSLAYDGRNRIILALDTNGTLTVYNPDLTVRWSIPGQGNIGSSTLSLNPRDSSIILAHNLLSGGNKIQIYTSNGTLTREYSSRLRPTGVCAPRPDTVFVRSVSLSSIIVVSSDGTIEDTIASFNVSGQWFIVSPDGQCYCNRHTSTLVCPAGAMVPSNVTEAIVEYDPYRGNIIRFIPEQPIYYRISPVVSASPDGSRIVVYSVDPGSREQVIPVTITYNYLNGTSKTIVENRTINIWSEVTLQIYSSNGTLLYNAVNLSEVLHRELGSPQNYFPARLMVSGVSWSPDGMLLAVAVQYSMIGNITIIYDQVLPDLIIVNRTHREWTNTSIALLLFDRQGNMIRTLNVETSQDHLDSRTGQAMWSPAGDKLLLATPDNLLILDENLNTAQSIPQTAFYPSWSPDGTRIAFINRGRLVIASANGTILATYNNGTVEAYTWSPTGESLALLTKTNGTRHIQIIAANGTLQATRLTESTHQRIPRDPTGCWTTLAWTGNKIYMAIDGYGIIAYNITKPATNQTIQEPDNTINITIPQTPSQNTPTPPPQNTTQKTQTTGPANTQNTSTQTRENNGRNGQSHITLTTIVLATITVILVLYTTKMRQSTPK